MTSLDDLLCNVCERRVARSHVEMCDDCIDRVVDDVQETPRRPLTEVERERLNDLLSDN